MGREDAHLCFQHEARASCYLVLCFCNFLASVATSPAIQVVLSAAVVSVQELILHSTWITMQQGGAEFQAVILNFLHSYRF